MKKITKTNFQGLRQLFPVLGKEEMRHYVGGTFDGYYYTGGWNSDGGYYGCLLYTSPSPRDGLLSRMPSSA